MRAAAGPSPPFDPTVQELVVREAAASFKDKFPSDSGMQSAAFSAAVRSLSGAQLAVTEDPVAAHFESAFKSLQGVDLSKAKADAKGSLAERVAFAQQAKEAEFKQSFMVTAAEAAEVKSIASGAKSGEGYDLSKLSADAMGRLEALYKSINGKVGYAMPDLAMKQIPLTSDAQANKYIEEVNSRVAAAQEQLRRARLTAFVSAF